MKDFFNKWIVPVLVVLAIVGFFLLGKKLKFLGLFAYEQKKKKLDEKVDAIQKQIEDNEKIIEKEHDAIEKDEEKIAKIEEEKKQFHKELEDAKNDHDKLDAMFADLLG